MSENNVDQPKIDLAKLRHDLAAVVQGMRTGTAYDPNGKPGLNPKLLQLSLEKLLSITQRLDRELNRE